MDRLKLKGVGEGVLASYAQVLLARSPLIGGMLLLATLAVPRMFVFGLGAVGLAMVTARAVGLSPALIRSGLFGYNALLIGLGGAALVQVTPLSVAFVVAMVMASVLVTAALHSALGVNLGLPALTLPFLVVFYVGLGVAPLAEVPLRSMATDPMAAALPLPELCSSYLQSLGALFFLPRVDVGMLILLALLWHSRIAVLLSAVAWTVVAVLASRLFVLGDPALMMALGYNCTLTAVALGGVWFVPSRSSFALAASGAVLCAACTLGLLPWLYQLGMPVLVLPFNMTVILVLYAMRQRVRDGLPKAVTFVPGTPEQNLNYYNTRLARFRSRYPVRIGLPFRGRWLCTQGVDGDVTHQGVWRDALDFEVIGDDGRAHTGAGTELADFRCYRLPVVAAADGVVARVVDGVPDNGVGQINTRDNWGNVVIVYHAPGLYSCVAHLSSGSVRVREGQPVKRGEALGACGSSGRSPVPHVHFQLQATATIGAPTLTMELHDVVTGDAMAGCHVPMEGKPVRNLESNGAHYLHFDHGQRLVLANDDRAESLLAEIDLYGRLVLRCGEGTLYYEHRAELFTVHDVIGTRSPLLSAVRAALSRVPFEAAESGITWTDILPLRPHLPVWLRPVFDVLAPFVGPMGLEMHYSAERFGAATVVRGRSRLRRTNGLPFVETRACLNGGIAELEIDIRGTTQRWLRRNETVTEPIGVWHPAARRSS